MMPQQSSVYSNMMGNQQQNVFNQTAGNRTPSQTPMSISNPQWTNNQTMNVARQPPNAYNTVRKRIIS